MNAWIQGLFNREYPRCLRVSMTEFYVVMNVVIQKCKFVVRWRFRNAEWELKAIERFV